MSTLLCFVRSLHRKFILSTSDDASSDGGHSREGNEESESRVLDAFGTVGNGADDCDDAIESQQ